jgi:hypothetical protein
MESTERPAFLTHRGQLCEGKSMTQTLTEAISLMILGGAIFCCLDLALELYLSHRQLQRWRKEESEKDV